MLTHPTDKGTCETSPLQAPADRRGEGRLRGEALAQLAEGPRGGGSSSAGQGRARGCFFEWLRAFYAPGRSYTWVFACGRYR